jgi:hypothetical protein
MELFYLLLGVFVTMLGVERELWAKYPKGNPN